MPELLLPTFATVLTIPILALTAAALAGAWEERRHRAAGSDPSGQSAHRSNERLRGFLFTASLAGGTTLALLASGVLTAAGWTLAPLGLVTLLAAGAAWRLTRAPHHVSARAAAGAAAWWSTFGFLAGLTAQVLIQGGLLSAAVLIGLVAFTGAQALSRDGGLRTAREPARAREPFEP